jgi:hypothetical protein
VSSLQWTTQVLSLFQDFCCQVPRLSSSRLPNSRMPKPRYELLLETFTSSLLRVRFKPRAALDRSNVCRLFRPRSYGLDLSLHCAIPELLGHESMVQILSRTLGIYGPDFFVAREAKGKRGKEFNTLVYSFNLMVVNDHRSSDKISFIDRYLFFESSRDSATSEPLQSLCTQSATSSEIFQKGYLYRKIYQPKMDKGIYFLRNGLNSELIQCAYIHINIFINISHMWPFHYKNETTIFESKHYRGSLILNPFIKLHRL